MAEEAGEKLWDLLAFCRERKLIDAFQIEDEVVLLTVGTVSRRLGLRQARAYLDWILKETGAPPPEADYGAAGEPPL